MNLKNAFKPFLLACFILPLTLAFPLCYLAKANTFIQNAVVALTIVTFFFSCKYWKTSIFAYIFCIPLFNTLTQVLKIPWPGLNFNAIVLSALVASWFCHYLFKNPISDKNPEIYCVSTPLDNYLIVLAFLVLLSFPIGWLRFSNIFSPGFIPDALRQAQQLTFFNLQENFLCFTRLIYFSLAFVSFYMIASTLRHHRDITTALWLIITAAALVCVYGITQRNLGFDWVGVNWFFHRINATLNGPDSAAIYFSIIIILCIPMLFIAKQFAAKVSIVTSFLIALTGLILTGTRTAVFALVIVSGCFLLFYLGMRLKRLKAISNILVTLVIIFFFLTPANSFVVPGQSIYPRIMQSRFLRDFENFKFNKEKFTQWLSFRNYHWHAASGVIKSYPISGSGLGTFDKLYKDYKLDEDAYKTAFAHSLYLDTYAESGLLALGALLFLYIAVAWLSWKLALCPNSSGNTKKIALALLAINIFSFIANFFTSSFYYVFELQLFLSLLLALLVVLYNVNVSHQIEPFSLSFLKIKDFFCRSKLRKISVATSAFLFFAIWACFLYGACIFGYNFFMSAKPYSSIDRILEYGIYHYEYDKNKNKFARTAKNVYKPLHLKNRFLRLYLRADHPNAVEHPVTSLVYIDDHLMQEVILSNRNWNIQVIDLKKFYSTLTDKDTTNIVHAVFHLSSDRTWNPLKTRRGNVDLDYGIDLGSINWGFFTKLKN